VHRSGTAVGGIRAPRRERRVNAEDSHESPPHKGFR
jgi:hypothetical protein